MMEYWFLKKNKIDHNSIDFIVLIECGNHTMIALSQSSKNVDLTIYGVFGLQTQPSIIPTFHHPMWLALKNSHQNQYSFPAIAG
ncbi:MAG: hypothetical protein ABII06_18005 [Pseudomonadota bacterium]